MLIKSIRNLYYKVVPELRRKQLYSLLHYSDVKAMRNSVFHSSKGDFSLRGFDEKKAIFVHIPKAAGTSVALSIFGELPYHYKAIDYIAFFGRKTFNNYFKFAFVRNPWDRLYSAYNFLIKGGWDEKDKAWAEENISQFSDFNDFIRNWLTNENSYKYMHFIPQFEFICDHQERMLINYLGYFETIEQDFAEICKKLNINASLKHTNKSTNQNYIKHYNEDSKEIVAKVYQKDIEKFGYKFDGIIQKTIIRN